MLRGGFPPPVRPLPGARPEPEAAEAVLLLSPEGPEAPHLRAALQARGVEVRLGPAMEAGCRPAAIVATWGDLAAPQGRARLAHLRRLLPALPLFAIDAAALARPVGPPFAVPDAEEACDLLAASGLGRFV